MDRINKIGRNLINYKSEYSKHYSPIVDESLMLALEAQLEKRLLDQELFDQIINDSISLSDFEKFIGNKREYVKSQKELLEEFEKVRAIVNESLTRLQFTDYIETESNTEINKISILKQYTISEEFIKMYFGLEDEDMTQIMKKKGFAEKFAVLRLTKIFKEIFSEMRPETEFTQGFSRVYYNKDVNGFSVDYKYHLQVDFINKENIDAKIKKIKDADKVVERKFLKKSGISFYNVKEVKKTNDSLDVSKISNNKFTEVKVESSEVDKIKNEVKEVEPTIETKQVEPKVEEKKPSIDKIVEQVANDRKEKIEKKKEDKKPEQKQEQKAPQPKVKESTEDYLDKDIEDSINNKEDVLEVINEVANIKIEEDNSLDFGADSFLDAGGFIPTDNEIEIPDDIPDLDMDFDSMEIEEVRMPIEDGDDDI